jgi:sulfoquinovose isomerase
MTSNAPVGISRKWVTLPNHQAWLLRQADTLFAFYERKIINPLGGFFNLDDRGEPIPVGDEGSALYATARMVHCFSIAALLGRPGADTIVDHGMQFLWACHRDPSNGGYYWAVGPDLPTDDTKQAYGHAFVLLAASSAKVAGHPDADRLLADVTSILEEHFWEVEHGAAAEQFTSDWQAYDHYRGQNSNMHLTEALMAAFEATGDNTYLHMAEQISDLIIRRHGAQNEWRLPEHYTADWQPDREYSGNQKLRPYGSTPGHWLEWARLLLQLWQLGSRRLDWLLDSAKNLFYRATTDGWDSEKGGFFYTVEFDGSPRIRDRFWWPCCEGIGAAAFLNSIDADANYEIWYRRIWDFIAMHFIDRNHGGWFPQTEESRGGNANLFYGKPDIYHALQACLIPLLPTTGSITRGLVNASLFRGVWPFI